MPTVARSQSVSNADVPHNPPKNVFIRRRPLAGRLNISIWTLLRLWGRGEGPPRRHLSPRVDGCTELDLQNYLNNLT
jgi:hypothetical protein